MGDLIFDRATRVSKPQPSRRLKEDRSGLLLCGSLVFLFKSGKRVETTVS
jgi:hypothetical protein